MEAIYPYAHIIHLILAIIFLGYVFTDLAVISALKSKFSKEDEQKINQELGKRSFKIFPLTLLFLILTGGIMMSKYINSNAGVFETDLQKILMFKIALALIIALGVLSNIYKKFTKKKKSTFMEFHFHKLVIVLGFLIVISSQWMFLA
ncbi:membrane protein [Sulfurimonas hongkongensis]|uniref:Membrane protein n=1 Tax=Sulfurimonas hongkongensis TaxID=1172190 RepID=T0J8L8_9BACT|nr:membrane protein [Sulfurimonas hongkongensis]EQB34316.1 membrane protein [Sulfurimonas hongkongensis]